MKKRLGILLAAVLLLLAGCDKNNAPVTDIGDGEIPQAAAPQMTTFTSESEETPAPEQTPISGEQTPAAEESAAQGEEPANIDPEGLVPGLAALTPEEVDGLGGYMRAEAENGRGVDAKESILLGSPCKAYIAWNADGKADAVYYVVKGGAESLPQGAAFYKEISEAAVIQYHKPLKTLQYGEGQADAVPYTEEEFAAALESGEMECSHMWLDDPQLKVLLTLDADEDGYEILLMYLTEDYYATLGLEPAES